MGGSGGGNSGSLGIIEDGWTDYGTGVSAPGSGGSGNGPSTPATGGSGDVTRGDGLPDNGPAGNGPAGNGPSTGGGEASGEGEGSGGYSWADDGGGDGGNLADEGEGTNANSRGANTQFTVAGRSIRDGWSGTYYQKKFFDSGWWTQRNVSYGPLIWVRDTVNGTPGFSSYPDGFHIDELILDSVFWQDGFSTMVLESL